MKLLSRGTKEQRVQWGFREPQKKMATSPVGVAMGCQNSSQGTELLLRCLFVLKDSFFKKIMTRHECVCVCGHVHEGGGAHV